MINRIDIVSIPVSDQSIAKQFYIDKLGFELIRENPMGPDQTWVEVGPPGAETSITLVTCFDSMPPGSVRGVVISTDDIEKAHLQLSRSGVEVSDISDAPWGRYSTFSDPDGNGWVLQQAV